MAEGSLPANKPEELFILNFLVKLFQSFHGEELMDLKASLEEDVNELLTAFPEQRLLKN